MRRFGCAALLTAGAMMFASGANAATVLINQAVDLSKISHSHLPGDELVTYFFSPIDATVHSGDTLILHFDFSAPLIAVGLTEVRTAAQSFPPPTPSVSVTTSSIKLSFLGTPVTLTGSNPFGAIHDVALATMTGSKLAGAPTTFLGLEFQFPVTLSATDLHLTTGFLQLGATHFTGPDLAIPEPSTWALILAGFFGAGAALRRRRPPFAEA